MKDEDLIPEFPDWTEINRVRGNDPLGMHRPSEAIYQTLLPGMTTITERYRYYSFFCWLLQAYLRQNKTNNFKKFRNFQIRAEGLYAMICAHGEKDIGIAGSDWATAKLVELENSPDQTIKFVEDDDPNSMKPVEHLKRGVGAFGGLYATQMKLMGMIEDGDDKLKKIPFCTYKAEELANGFGIALGEMESEFLEAIETGCVSLNTIENLSNIKLSGIEVNSIEHKELSSFLMESHIKGKNYESNRRNTLMMLLRLVKFCKYKPAEEEIKWTWFGSDVNEKYRSGEEYHQKKWKVFQLNDLIRLCYQFLLHCVVQTLKYSENETMNLNEIINKLIDEFKLPKKLTVNNWIKKCMDGNEASEVRVRKIYEEMFEAYNNRDFNLYGKLALQLIFMVISITNDSDLEVFYFFKELKDFQSLYTEERFLKEKFQHNLRAVSETLIRERIILRHLVVATRKLRYQNSYTFLFEPDDFGLRFRNEFKISESSPRLKQALRFLEDINYIDVRGITKIGKEEIK